MVDRFGPKSDPPSSHDQAASPRSVAKVAACILAYNHEAVIADAVRTALEQDFQDFELILSDDCSTDGTWDVMRAMAASDARIRAIRTPHNLGMAGNANFAVAHSTSPFIALLHHDDMYAPSLFRRWLVVMERDSEVGFVSNGYDNEGRIDVSAFDEINDGILILERTLLLTWHSPFRGTGLIRRSCWDALGGMRERFGMVADVDLWMRLAARWRVGYVAEPLIKVRHRRPADYPNAYVGWSWPRWRLVYDLHGVNRLDHYGVDTLLGRARWAHYRLRVSGNILYWLAYALYKRRWDMLATSGEIENEYELMAERVLRRSLAALAHLGTRASQSRSAR